MNETILKEHYQKRKFSTEQTDEAVAAVHALEDWLSVNNGTLETATPELIRSYIRLLIDQKRNTMEALLAMARYFYLTGRNETYIYFTSLLGGDGVIENIATRLTEATDADTSERLLGSTARPPLGSDPTDFPAFTKRLMERLEAELPLETVQRVLAGNNHQIPPSAFATEKEHFENAASLEEYLRGRHKRNVFELQQHCDSNAVWFEQTITQDVVDFVAANQEILSAVKDGDALYITKIPYDPEKYLTETDPTMRRYYACHCPFAREAIKAGSPDISPNWCYCSAGFAKHPFEVLFERPLRVKLLQSVLKGDPVCRFAIHLD